MIFDYVVKQIHSTSGERARCEGYCVISGYLFIIYKYSSVIYIVCVLPLVHQLLSTYSPVIHVCRGRHRVQKVKILSHICSSQFNEFNSVFVQFFCMKICQIARYSVKLLDRVHTYCTSGSQSVGLWILVACQSIERSKGSLEGVEREESIY